MWQWELPIPAPDGLVGALLTLLSTLRSPSLPVSFPIAPFSREKLQETSPRRTAMISDLAGQEIPFLPALGQALLGGTRGAVECLLQARGVWLPRGI